MTTEQQEILKKLAELHSVLQWSTEHAVAEPNIALTVGERIIVNQERGALFRELEKDPREFMPSPTVDEKVNQILYIVKRTNWQPKD